MPPASDPADLEALLHDALSSIAVTAYSRGIGLSAHIDNRLASPVLCDADALKWFLRRGLSRMVETGRPEKIALAIWRDDAGDDGILLEACRAMAGGETQLTGLTGLWALPVNGTMVQPRPARQSDGVESVLISLPCMAARDAVPVARKWRESFRGRHGIIVRDLLFDHERLVASFAEIGLTVAFAMSGSQALEIARAGARDGQPPDILLLDRDLLGDGAASLAQQLRADPALSGSCILLSIDRPRVDPPDNKDGLFDAVQRTPMPWPRLIDVLRVLDNSAAGSPDRPAPPQAAASAATGQIPGLAGRRILIAEDVATNQVLLEAMLEPTGAEVEAVTDGAAVLARQAEAPADLILMDLQMPGMGGIAAMRHLRETGGDKSAVRVVALTAYARDADRQLALDAGMDAYLVKPIVMTEFYDLLRRLLPENGN